MNDVGGRRYPRAVALYRKYRPATFAEVVGQEHVTEPLSTALDTGRISHAYLFSGPRGCGKTSSARILARSLNCVEGPTSRPCGVCSSCVALAPGGPGNLDVIELDAASHGGVDDTRELRDRAFYAPAESRYRVFIVDEAHMVTTAGFNALLKIVEEPPAHLIFVFATTEPDKVLPTIRSRTHHYPFRLLPPATMRGLLGKICEQEGVQVEEAVYPLVIRAGGGSPRDSLSVLDQLLAGAGTEGVTYQRALALLGVTDIALIDEAVEALVAGDGAALFGTVDRVVEAGHDPRRFATDLLERMRDLILLRAVPDATDRNLVTGPGDVLDRMRDQAERIGPATLTRYAELLHEGLGEMRGATAPRLLLEVVCARMLLPAVSDAESATLQRLERLERGMAGGAPAAARPATNQAPSAPAQPGGESVPSPAPAGGGSRRRGAEALAAIRAEKTPPTASSTTDTDVHGSPPVREPVSQEVGSSVSAMPSDPESSSQAVGDVARVAQEQRPHPAQRAQAPHGPDSPAAQPLSDPATPMMDAAADTAEVALADRSGVRAETPAPQAGSIDALDSSAHGDEPEVSAGPVADDAVRPDPSDGSDATAELFEPSGQAAQDISDGAPAGGISAEALPIDTESSPEPTTSAAASPGADADVSGQLDAHGSADASGPADAHGSADAPSTADAHGGADVSSPAGARGSADASNPTGARGGADVSDQVEALGDADVSGQAVGAAGAAEMAGAVEDLGAVGGAAAAGAPAGDVVGEVEAKWGEIRGKVREFGAAVHALLSGASVARVEGDTIVFAHQHAPLAQRLSNPKYVEAVQGAVRAVLGREYGVRWEVGSGAPPAGGGRAQSGAPSRGGAAQVRGGAAPAQGGSGQSRPPQGETPRFTRPSQSRTTSPEASGSTSARGRESSPAGNDSSAPPPPPDDDIPLPDGPDLPDDPGPSGYSSVGYDGVPPAPTPEEEQEMLDESARPAPPGDRRDPDEVALELLASELGATRLEA